MWHGADGVFRAETQVGQEVEASLGNWRILGGYLALGVLGRDCGLFREKCLFPLHRLCSY